MCCCRRRFAGESGRVLADDTCSTDSHPAFDRHTACHIHACTAPYIHAHAHVIAYLDAYHCSHSFADLHVRSYSRRRDRPWALPPIGDD